MSKNLILVREIAILLGASIILALSYNAFSPKPLALIRTETTSIASDSLITALATTTTTQQPSSLQNSATTALSNASASQSLSQSASTIQENNATTPLASSKTPTTQPQTSSGVISEQKQSDPAKIGATQSSSPPQIEKATTEAPKTEIPKAAKALEIRTDQVEKLLTNPDVLFIDARPTHEYQLGHIDNAINIFTPEFEQNIPRIIGLPREKPIVAYCGGGACELSHELADNLLKMGFQRVFVYVGGWNEWKQRK